jgi:DNA-3-methyladenine glycosylase
MARQILPRSFYERPPEVVAPELLNKVVVVGRRAARIVEVEAYRGAGDPASHAFRGQTPRNAAMFAGGGRLYVYFTYGMHFCANVVTGTGRDGQAVLLRAVEPVAGTARMRRNRGLGRSADPRLLCSGPARLCQALSITRGDNGADLLGTEIWVGRDPAARPAAVTATTRVGIRHGRHHRWRFLLRDNPFVSRGKPAVP